MSMLPLRMESLVGLMNLLSWQPHHHLSPGYPTANVCNIISAPDTSSHPVAKASEREGCYQREEVSPGSSIHNVSTGHRIGPA
eukprot:542496-Rhodomonas_salina.1